MPSGRKQIAPNPDVLGLASACFFATVAMAVGFWRQMDGFAISIRVALVFVVSYAATFLLVRYAVRTMLAEMLERKRQQQEEYRAQMAAGGPPGSSSTASQGSSSAGGRESQ